MGDSFDMAALRELLHDHLDRADSLADEHYRALSGWRRHLLEGVMRCGDPYHGFVWLRCDDCNVDGVLATSCKARLVCPRCGGRRMASTAAQLVDHVLPEQKLRQWVVTFPQPLPRLLAWRPELLKRILADVSTVIQDDLRRRTGEPHGKGGLVSFVQNFTGDLRCYVHLHCLVPDGVFVDVDGEDVRFCPAPIPTQADIQRVAEELAGRVHRTVVRWRREVENRDELTDGLLVELGRLGEEVVGETSGRKADRPAARERRWLGEHLGVALHAGVTVDKGDARGRERMVRYVARPALSLSRIHREEDGRVRIQFKRPWRSGATSLLLRPEVFVLRLASLVMPPRVNLVRFHGVFAPASPLRARVVPHPVEPPVQKRSRWIPWKTLICRVFGRTAGLCPVCGSPMRRVQTLQGQGRAWNVLRWIHSFGTVHPVKVPP